LTDPSRIPARTRRQELQDTQSSRAPFHIEKTASDGCHLLAKLGVADRGEAAVIARQAKRPAKRCRMALGSMALTVPSDLIRSVA
jgi:hypothetical protein